jgi:hypothetical protein
MNIYNYNWWEVLTFIIILELIALGMSAFLLNIWAGDSFKGRWRRKKKPSGFKSGLA